MFSDKCKHTRGFPWEECSQPGPPFLQKMITCSNNRASRSKALLIGTSHLISLEQNKTAQGNNRPVYLDICVPCNLETSRSLQTARWPCSLQTACHAVCRLRGHRFNGVYYIVPACLFCSNIIQTYLLYSNYMHVCALER